MAEEKKKTGERKASFDIAFNVLYMLGEDPSWGAEAIRECDGDICSLLLMMFQEKERELEVVRRQHRDVTARGRNAELAPPAAPTRPTISMSALARDVQGLTPEITKKLIVAAKLVPVPNTDSSWELYDREAAMAAASVYLSEFPAERLREVNEKLREQGVKVSALQKSLSAYETGSKSPKALQKTNDELRALLDKRQADHSETRQDLAKAGQEIIALKADLLAAKGKLAEAGANGEAQAKIADLEARLALAIKARQAADDREQAALQKVREVEVEKRPEHAHSAAVVGEETVQRIRNLQADLREKEREIAQLNEALTEANAKLATKKLVTADQIACPECGSDKVYKFRGGKRMACRNCNSEMAVA